MLKDKLDLLRKFLVTILLLHIISASLQCQHLSFTRPVSFFPNVQSNKAPDIINFNGNYFIAWKETAGKLSFSYLGTQYDTASAETIVTVPDAQTGFAPVFSVLNG